MACKNPTKFFPAVKSLMLPVGCMKGKIAFVTGGGTGTETFFSSLYSKENLNVFLLAGLGRAMALCLARLGADVIIASR